MWLFGYGGLGERCPPNPPYIPSPLGCVFFADSEIITEGVSSENSDNRCGEYRRHDGEKCARAGHDIVFGVRDVDSPKVRTLLEDVDGRAGLTLVFCFLMPYLQRMWMACCRVVFILSPTRGLPFSTS